MKTKTPAKSSAKTPPPPPPVVTPPPPPAAPSSTAFLECVRCGCRHFEVLYTRIKEDLKGTPYRMRRRACRNCGWQTSTKETPF